MAQFIDFVKYILRQSKLLLQFRHNFMILDRPFGQAYNNVKEDGM